MDDQLHTPWWRRRNTLILLGLFLIVGILLLTGHQAHLAAALPFLFLLACPLMHLFMPHGHGGHHGNDGGEP